MIWHDEMCARVRNGMLLTLSEVRSNNASQLAAHDAQENHGAEGTRSTAMFQNSLTGEGRRICQGRTDIEMIWKDACANHC